MTKINREKQQTKNFKKKKENGEKVGNREEYKRVRERARGGWRERKFALFCPFQLSNESDLRNNGDLDTCGTACQTPLTLPQYLSFPFLLSRHVATTYVEPKVQ